MYLFCMCTSTQGSKASNNASSSPVTQPAYFVCVPQHKELCMCAPTQGALYVFPNTKRFVCVPLCMCTPTQGGYAPLCVFMCVCMCVCSRSSYTCVCTCVCTCVFIIYSERKEVIHLCLVCTCVKTLSQSFALQLA